MLDLAPSDHWRNAAMTADAHMIVILTMQMRHLYRSPLSICLSSSLIRAFRASMVVAVDSSSVTLEERNRRRDEENESESLQLNTQSDIFNAPRPI